MVLHICQAVLTYPESFQAIQIGDRIAIIAQWGDINGENVISGFIDAKFTPHSNLCKVYSVLGIHAHAFHRIRLLLQVLCIFEKKTLCMKKA